VITETGNIDTSEIAGLENSGTIGNINLHIIHENLSGGQAYKIG